MYCNKLAMNDGEKCGMMYCICIWLYPCMWCNAPLVLYVEDVPAVC